MPPVTRAYITLSFLTTAGCALEVGAIAVIKLYQLGQPASARYASSLQVISPFNIYFNARLIFQKGEVWRLLTTFMFFGSLGQSLLCCVMLPADVSKLVQQKQALPGTLLCIKSAGTRKHALPQSVNILLPYHATGHIQTYAVEVRSVAAGLDFVFHMFFLIKYSKSLEEGSFRGRSADFLWMLLVGKLWTAAITSCKPTSDAGCLQLAVINTDIPRLLLGRWSSTDMLRPICQCPIPRLILDIHDGESACQCSTSSPACMATTKMLTTNLASMLEACRISHVLPG